MKEAQASSEHEERCKARMFEVDVAWALLRGTDASTVQGSQPPASGGDGRHHLDDGAMVAWP